MPEQRFQLSINIRVQQLRDSGTGQWWPDSSNGLEVREDIQVSAAGFMEVAAILSRFHDLAQMIDASSSSSSPQPG